MVTAAGWEPGAKGYTGAWKLGGLSSVSDVLCEFGQVTQLLQLPKGDKDSTQGGSERQMTGCGAGRCQVSPHRGHPEVPDAQVTQDSSTISFPPGCLLPQEQEDDMDTGLMTVSQHSVGMGSMCSRAEASCPRSR